MACNFCCCFFYPFCPNAVCAIILCDWRYRLWAPYSVAVAVVFAPFLTLTHVEERPCSGKYILLAFSSIEKSHILNKINTLRHLISSSTFRLHPLSLAWNFSSFFFLSSSLFCLRHNKLFNTHFLSLNTYYCCIDQPQKLTQASIPLVWFALLQFCLVVFTLVVMLSDSLSYNNLMLREAGAYAWAP